LKPNFDKKKKYIVDVGRTNDYLVNRRDSKVDIE